MHQGFHRVAVFLPLAALFWLAGCTTSEAVKSPLLQRFVWFDYLNGSDIREECQPGTPWRTRLVYNARYKEQIRRYEMISDGADGAIQVSRAQGSGFKGSLSLGDPLKDLEWLRSEVRLSAAEVAEFEAALRQSGFYGKPPVGTTLPSAGFYWVAVSCRDGAVTFNAWRLPAEKGREPTFPDFLFAHDKTEVEVNPPREIDAAQLTFNQATLSDRKGPVRFFLRVDEDGLAGY